MKILLIIAIICMSLMTGCSQVSLPSNSFYLENKISIDGSITQTISFPTYKTLLLENYSENRVNHFMFDLCSQIEKNFYSTIYLNYWLKYSENFDIKYELNGDLVKITKPQITDENIYFSISFLTLDAWNYYNSTENTVKEDADNNNIFIKKSQKEFDFPFDYEMMDMFIDAFTLCLKMNFPYMDYNNLTYVFEYRYVTPYARIKSNASYKMQQNNYYIHSWVVNYSKNIDQKINIWVNQVNYWVWYLVVFVIFSGLALLICVIFKIKEKR